MSLSFSGKTSSCVYAFVSLEWPSQTRLPANGLTTVCGKYFACMSSQPTRQKYRPVKLSFAFATRKLTFKASRVAKNSEFFCAFLLRQVPLPSASISMELFLHFLLSNFPRWHPALFALRHIFILFRSFFLLIHSTRQKTAINFEILKLRSPFLLLQCTVSGLLLPLLHSFSLPPFISLSLSLPSFLSFSPSLSLSPFLRRRRRIWACRSIKSL